MEYSIEEFDKAKTKVMNYIMYKKRTEYEVKNKFSKKLEENLLDDIIEYIKEAGYLSDLEYIKRAISEFQALNNLSRKEIKYKLYSKGIDNNLIEDYFSENAEELYEYIIASCKETVPIVKKGIFGADMKVSLINDGPFTIVLDSEQL